MNIGSPLQAGIELYSKAVKNCVCLIDGEIKSETELLDSSPAETSNKSSGGGKKKHSKQASNSEERMKTVNVQILIPEVLIYRHVVYDPIL